MRGIVTAFLIAGFVAVGAGLVHAGGSTPPESQCSKNCKAEYGDPFKPNHPYEVEARTYTQNADGTWVTNYTQNKLPICEVPRKKCGYAWWRYDCSCYEQGKPTWDPNNSGAYNQCQARC